MLSEAQNAKSDQRFAAASWYSLLCSALGTLEISLLAVVICICIDMVKSNNKLRYVSYLPVATARSAALMLLSVVSDASA